MQLQVDQITIQCEHVVDTSILETFNINRFVDCYFDQASELVIIRDDDWFLVGETVIVCEDAKDAIHCWRVLKISDLNHIYFSEGVSSFQRHDVVKSLRNEDILIIMIAHFLNFVGSLEMWTHVTGVSLCLRSNSTFDCIALMKSKAHLWFLTPSKLKDKLRSVIILRQYLRSSHFANDFDDSNQTLVSNFGSFFK